ncbi:MAG: asparagine synthase (glutamine-hydrolyzing) [Gemmatimonadales bacterium]
MCGLAGFWHRDGARADGDNARRMLDRQRHRGPDDRGVWADGPVALGLDRLSILDLTPHGHQPFVMPDGSSALAYNGEVYNWRELRSELATEGVQFTSDCDSEVVLHAMHRWGPEAAVPRFNGMFALAWFDRRSGTLWLARDRSGIKPLYVAETAGLLVFASEIKGVLGHPAIPAVPDVHALVTQVCLERLVGDWTAFVGVKSVVPGTLMRCSPESVSTITWFDLERDIDVERIIRSGREPFDKQVKTFRGLLERSVEAHLQSDAPLAVMCSGGLDSSLTTAIARRHKPDLVAFVADADGVTPSEADKAAQVAKHLAVRLHRVRITDEEFPELWASAAWYNDEPLYFHQNPLALKVSRAVQQEGFKVLVTGEGSDELFGGYRWQSDVAEMWRLRQRHARFIPDVAPFRTLGRWLGAFAPFDLGELAAEPFERRSTWLQAPPGAELVIDGGMRQHRARSLFARLQAIPRLDERALLAREFDDFYHHLRVLLNANDKMTMAASIEARVPFIENEIIDFGLHLSPGAKYDRRQRKRIVKSAAAGLLPDAIIHAPKVGFAIPDRFMTGYEGLLHGGMVPELFKWHPRETARMHEVMRRHPMVGRKVVGMELWAQLYFNGATPGSLAERLRAVRTLR